MTRQQVRTELKSLSKEKAPTTLNRYKAALSSLYRFLSDECSLCL